MLLKKVVPIGLASLMAMTSAVPAFAASSNVNSVGSVANDYYGTNATMTGQDQTQGAMSRSKEFSDDTTSEAEVYVTQSSTFNVKIPKVIVLNGTSGQENSGIYSVNAKGNIAGNEIISVKPLSNDAVVEKQSDTSLNAEKTQFYMGQEGKKDIVTTINQTKTKFTYEDGVRTDEAVETTGKVTASDMTAGSWSGTFNFDISLDELEYAEEYYDLDSTAVLANYANFNTTNGVGNIYYDNNRDVITKTPVEVPYGTSVVFDKAAFKEMTGIANPSIRVYYFDKNTNKNVQISTLSAENGGAVNAASGTSDNNFIVKDEDGMLLNFRLIHWNDTFTEETLEAFKECLHFYNLNDVDGSIFDYNTIEQCWENENTYEAWPHNCIVYDKNSNLYYAFYTSQEEHTVYSKNVIFRTSTDLENWSDSKIAYSINDENEVISINGAVINDDGSITLSILSVINNIRTSYLVKSNDCFETYEKFGLMVDGETADKYMSVNRITKIDNGMILSCYFDSRYNVNTKIIYSTDGGVTWKTSNWTQTTPISEKSNEYDFVLLNNDDILCIQRTDSGMYACLSTDNAKSFSKAKAINCRASGDIQNYSTPPEIFYNAETDALEIYYVDRYGFGALNCLYTSGRNMAAWLLNDNDKLDGVCVVNSQLNGVGLIDMGYPEVVKMADGTVKCFFYNRTDDVEGTASIYSITAK